MESRVLLVMGCVPRYSDDQLFEVLGDGAELGEICLHDQQVLRDMFEVMVRQRGVVAVSWQGSTVVFQGQDIQASTRHDEGQLCAQEDITASKSSLIMVCW